MKATKQQLIDALRAFINQRSGIDFRNYDSRESLMGDYRPMVKHGRHARQMLQAVAWRDSITAQHLIDATRAFSGRLQFKENGNGVSVEYTTGQYFCTEYRQAACAVLKQALWDFWRVDHKTGNAIQRKAKIELGRGIAKEWFS